MKIFTLVCFVVCAVGMFLPPMNWLNIANAFSAGLFLGKLIPGSLE